MHSQWPLWDSEGMGLLCNATGQAHASEDASWCQQNLEQLM